MNERARSGCRRRFPLRRTLSLSLALAIGSTSVPIVPGLPIVSPPTAAAAGTPTGTIMWTDVHPVTGVYEATARRPGGVPWFVTSDGLPKGDVALSNDGMRVAATIGCEGACGPHWGKVGVYLLGTEAPTALEFIHAPEPHIQSPGHLEWSPDDTKLAAAFNTGVGQWRISLAPSDLSSLAVQLVQLPNGQNLRTFHWSPDGTRIAYVTEPSSGVGAGRIGVVDVASGQSRTIHNEAPPDIGWSPDGTQIRFTRVAASENNGALLEVPADGSTAAVTIQETPGRNFRAYSFSPDGEWAYVWGSNDQGATAFFTPIDDPAVRIPAGFEDAGSRGWARATLEPPDDDGVPNGVQPPDDILDPPGTYTMAFQSSTLPFSPYKPFAWWSGLAGPVPLLGPTDDDEIFTNPDLSPDGKLVAVERYRMFEEPGSVAVYRVGTSTPLWTVPALPGADPQSGRSSGDAIWSPDGQRLIFFRTTGSLPSQMSTWVADADGGNMQQVFAGGPTSSVFSWLDDDTLLRARPTRTGEVDIVEVDLATGSETQVVAPDPPGTSAGVSQGDFDAAMPGYVVASVRVSGGTTDWELRGYHYSGTAIEQRTGLLGFRPSVASDGTVMYVVQGESRLRVVNLDAPATTLDITAPPGFLQPVNGNSWSPGRPDFGTTDGGGGTPIPGTTYTVNTTVGTGADTGCSPAPGECTLAEAILASNANPGPDTITVATPSNSPVFAITAELPAITGAVTFNVGADGQCAAGSITLDGSGAAPGTRGLVIDHQNVDPGGPTTIAGITVVGFPNDGIVILDSRDITIDCSQTRSNATGALVRRSSGITFGTGPDSVYFVGNSNEGLDVRNSQRVEVIGAHLGTPNSADGNSGTGAWITDSNDVRIHASRIGGNGNDGVVVYGASSRVRISADYTIQGNGQEAIDLGADGPTPNDVGDTDTNGPNEWVNAPTIIGFETAPVLAAVVRLEHAPLAGATRVDVYVNSTCDDSGAGEGEEPAGTGIFQLDGTSRLVRVPLEDQWPGGAYTATSTVRGIGTSEFSLCQAQETVPGPLPPGPFVSPISTDPTVDIEDSGDGGGNDNADPDANGVAPQAIDDLVMVIRGEDAVWPAPGILENDTGGPGLRAIELRGSGTMPDGAWTLRRSGALTVDGRLVAPGEYTASYRVIDPDGISDIAQITFLVIDDHTPLVPVEESPVARPDRINIAPGQTKTIPTPALLGNDTDPDHDPLTAVQPAAGTLPLSRITLSPNGAVTVRASGLAEGEYTFTYRARDDTGRLSLPATVTVVVDNNNACPTPVDDVYDLVAGDVRDFTPDRGPLRNDVDPEANLGTIDVVGATAATGETASVAFSVNGLTLYRNGRLKIDGGPKFVNRDLPPGSAVQRLIRYTLTDSLGESCPDRIASLRVTFTGNQAPVAVSNQFAISPEAPNGNAYQVKKGGTLTIPTRGLLANDHDPDGPQASLRAAYVDKQFASGSVTVNATGGFTLKAPSTGINVGDDITFRYVAIDNHGARSAPATVTVRITANPPVLKPPVARSDVHTVHADGILLLNGNKSLLANDSDPTGQNMYVEPAAAVDADPRIEMKRDGTVRFFPTLADIGKTFTFSYRAIDFDGLQSAVAQLTIKVVAPRERCTTTGVRTVAEIGAAAAASVGEFRHCFDLTKVTKFGFVDDADAWRPKSPVASGALIGTPQDLTIDDGDLASVSTLLRWFLDDITGVVDIDPGDPATSPRLIGSASQVSYVATANWDACVDILGPAVAVIRATRVQAIVKGLKRIPFLGGIVDDVIGASATYLTANAQMTVKVLSLVLGALDFFGEDNFVKDWFLEAVRYTEVDVRQADGAVRRVPVFAALIQVIGGFEIVDDLFCKNWAGWTPASSAVTVSATTTGGSTVKDELYINGYLENIDFWSPGSLEWSTDVEPGATTIVGPDLYTGS